MGGRSAARAALTAGAAFAAGAGLTGCGEPAATRASLSVAETLADADTAGYARATAPRTFTFPADHGPHPEFKHEWWYFTGNLRAAEAEGGTGAGRGFGFQLTFFRSALRPEPPSVDSDWATSQAWMGHFAVTDVAGEAFHAFERFERGALGLAGTEEEEEEEEEEEGEGEGEGEVRVWVGDWEVGLGVEAGEGFRVRAEEDGVGVDLVLEAVDPVVLQGDDGLSAKGPERGNASYYYSLMRLRARGTVRAGGAEHRVEGWAWLDREWSTSALSPGLVGWDWFALQLDDGSELMVYRLREDDGGTAPYSAGTFVGPAGRVTRLGAGDFELEATGTWESPRGGRYPSGWRVRVPGLGVDLAVEPRLRDQELDLAFRYWEGAVTAEGALAGRPVSGLGYVELTGYADAPRP